MTIQTVVNAQDLKTLHPLYGQFYLSEPYVTPNINHKAKLVKEYLQTITLDNLDVQIYLGIPVEQYDTGSPSD